MADNGKWYFRSNYDARIIENDTHVAGVFAELYRLYTIEYCEERSIPEGADLEEERADLWGVCNSEVDNQLEDIIKMSK